ncbi:MAG TPA: homoserine dehydrogenase [Longimicrobiales bacterium]
MSAAGIRVLERARAVEVATTHAPRLRVAVAGCGVVGGELVRALLRDPRYEIVRVLVRDAARPRVIPFDERLLTDDLDSFLHTPADIVAEATGDVEAAAAIARAARRQSARFVTANKALIASGVPCGRAESVHFDAAVGGGVPIIRLLRTALAGAAIRSVSGILNGTSNFVLSGLENGASIDAVLADARRRGLAESDPSRDLDGRDAADKTAIIAWTAFGIPPGHVRVETHGLLPDPVRLVADARATGGVVRLIGTVRAVPDAGIGATAGIGAAAGIAAAVEPVIVRPGSPFGRTVGEANRVLVDAGWTSAIELAGPGAGGAPTAAAMLADIRHPCPPVREQDALIESVDDPALHEWSISALDQSHIESPFEAAGVPLIARERDGDYVRLRVGPSARAELRGIIRTLRSLGSRPLLARLDPEVAR